MSARVSIRFGIPIKLAAFLLAACFLAPLVAHAAPDLNEQRLEGIAPIVEAAVKANKIPGAVVLIGHDGRVVYRKAFGERSLVPERQPMMADTIFDMASMTKVMATTTAVMQLVEQGKIVLSAPVSDYWPEFKQNGKELVTIRELMTHYSGLPPDLPLKPAWTGYDTAMQMIVASKLDAPPGTRFIYSDINFETLGEIVRRVSGETAGRLLRGAHLRAAGHEGHAVHAPRLARAAALPPRNTSTAPAARCSGASCTIPPSRFMGGVAGHAGLFSTADDVSIFAQMLLDGGIYNGARILSPLSVEKMTDAADSSQQDGRCAASAGISTRLSLPIAASCLTWARLGTPATRELPFGLTPSPRPT